MTEYKFCKVLNAEYKVTGKILDIYNIYFTSTYYKKGTKKIELTRQNACITNFKILFQNKILNS